MEFWKLTIGTTLVLQFPQATVNAKTKTMRRMILLGCFYLVAVTGYAQLTRRVKSGTPLRWGMNSSHEIMEGDLKQYYGTTDTAANKRYSTRVSTIANPHSVQFRNLQAQCDNNSMLVNWVATQQFGTNFFEIEQSDDNSNHWKVIGSVPASQTGPGRASYNFSYYKNAPNSVFRVVAIANTGERLYSSIFESPCSVNSFLSVMPNPVFSTATLRIGSPNPTKLKLLLVDASGVVVQNRDVSILQGSTNLSLDMSSLQSGYYVLAIQWMNGKQNTVNIIKQ